MKSNYLHSVKLQLEYNKLLAEKSFIQLDDKDLLWQYNEASNSIAIIVNHLHGNMKSRWTDFLTSDGEKEWRKRDQEFEDIISSRDEMLTLWEDGWDCLFTSLSTLKPDDLKQTIYIRNMGQTVIEAINRQLCHYTYHIGQIVYIARMIKNDSWESLSIPKNKSNKYNSDKFSKPKHLEHFTEEYLKNKRKTE